MSESAALAEAVRQYVDAARTVAKSRPKPTNPSLDALVQQHKELIASIASLTQSLNRKEPEEPEVENVERMAMLSVMKGYEALSKSIVDRLEQKPEEWSFTHEYDDDGNVINTIAKRI